MTFLVLIVELVVLSIISRMLQETLYSFFFIVVRTRSVAISIMTALLFPGTVIHELSHLFVAEILGVKTGKLTLAPESIRGSQIDAGSVAVTQTDPVRRAIIGIAPLAIGILTLVGISYLYGLQKINNINIISIIYFYIIFAVSSTMFPSSSDTKGLPALIAVCALFLGAAYLVGFRLSITGKVMELVNELLSSLTLSLGFVLAVNIVGVIVIKILVTLTGKIPRR